MFKSKQISFWAAALLMLSAVAYALVSLVNHSLFRTYGLDLGLYTHAMFDYAHGRMDDCTFFELSPRSFLSDHFDLYLVLLSPLVWVLGSYTLLVVQVVAVLFGAWGVFRWVSLCDGERQRRDAGGMESEAAVGSWLGVAAMGSFLLFFGVWQALGFDYHSNVVAAMWVPWIFYWLARGRYGLYFMAVVLVCVGKENMPLWLVFVLLALMWDYRRNPKALRWLGAGMAFGVVYLVVVTMVVMPRLSGGGAHFMGKFKYMGEGFGAVAAWVVAHPWESVRNLFVNFLDLPQGDGLKGEFYVCLLLSGGVLCVLRPNWLLMWVPLVGQKMLADDIALWGVGSHYSVEFAPVVVCGAFAVLSGWRHRRARVATAVATLLLTAMVTVYTCSSPRAWVQRENVRLFDKRHYRQERFDCGYARRLMEAIPREARVCASQCFTPHLALREGVYLYPVGLAHGAEYVLVVREDLTADTAGLRLIESDGTLYLFQTKAE